MLATKSLTRRFGAATAVDALTIAVHAGEVFGLLGPNGAGKTTLLKMLAGLEEPDAGLVGKSTVIKMLTTLLPITTGAARVAGFDITHQAVAVRRVIGYVPQALSADGALSGYENLLIFAKLYHLPHAEREQRVREALAFMGLTDAAEKLVRTYSGGMIRRLEIAQSTLHRPRVLFLDEPTVGLDPLARSAVWEHLLRLRAVYGTTIFLTTHAMEEADRLCDRVAIMHQGRVAVVGAPAELKASIGGNGHTLDDVFKHYAGDVLETGGNYRDTASERRTARRLG